MSTIVYDNTTNNNFNQEENIMAIVDNMKKMDHTEKHNKGRQSKSWKSEYFVTEGAIQINTYGSKDRKYPEKVSQIICFEGEALKQLANALQEIQDLNNKK